MKSLAIFLCLVLLACTASAQAVSTKLDVFTKNLDAGEDARALLSIQTGLNASFKTDVVVTYLVEDSSGNLIIQKTGTFPVTESRDIVLKLTVPDGTPDGKYYFRASSRVGESRSEAAGEFFIGEQSQDYTGYIVLAVAVAVLAVVLAAKRRKR